MIGVIDMITLLSFGMIVGHLIFHAMGAYK